MSKKDIDTKDLTNDLAFSFENYELEIIYVYYLMKKYKYDYKKYKYMSNDYPFYFTGVIEDLLHDKKVADNEKQILTLFDEYKDSLNDVLEPDVLINGLEIEELFNLIDEEIIRQALNKYMDFYLNLSDKDKYNRLNMLFSQTLFNGYNKLHKTLVFTDSSELIKLIIDNQIEADIVYNCFELDYDWKYELSLREKIQILLNILGLDDKIHIFKGDVLFNTYETDKKYDLITIFYDNNYKIPSNMSQRKIMEIRKIENLSKNPSISDEYFYINEAYKYLENNGTITSMISNLALYKTADDAIKKEMIDKKMIKSIVTIQDVANFITLQDGNNEIEFMCYDEIRSLTQLCDRYKKINIKDISNYDLRPIKILFGNNTKNPNLKELNNFLIDCYRGCQSLSLNFDDNGEFEVLTVSDIDDGIIGENLKRFNYERKNLNRFLKYLLKENDIVVSTHGSKIKIAIVENILNRKIIPNANFIILRPNPEKINPYYLEAYLTSKVGIKSLLNISTGKSNIIINEGNMRNLLIYVKEMDKQNKIGEIIKSQRKHITYLKNKLKDAISEMNAYIDEEILEEFIED